MANIGARINPEPPKTPRFVKSKKSFYKSEKSSWQIGAPMLPWKHPEGKPKTKGGRKMNTAECSRIILGLRAAGWSEKAINDFILWIESGDTQYKPKQVEGKEDKKEKKPCQVVRVPGRATQKPTNHSQLRVFWLYPLIAVKSIHKGE